MAKLRIPGFAADGSGYKSGVRYRRTPAAPQKTGVSAQQADLVVGGPVGHVFCGLCERGFRICCSYRGCYVERCFPV